MGTLFLSYGSLSSLAILLPQFDDAFQIRKETKQLSILSIIGIIFWFVVNFIVKPEPGHLDNVLLTTLHIIILIIPSYYSLPWVFKQFGLPLWFWNIDKFLDSHYLEKKHGFDRDLSRPSNSFNPQSISLSPTGSSNAEINIIRIPSPDLNGYKLSVILDDKDKKIKKKKKKRTLKFKSMFEDKEWLNLFSKHLNNEFAIENFLFFVGMY